jgi:hypothetical protein
MMGPIETSALIGGAILVGIVSHEWAHAGVAIALGWPFAIDWRRLETRVWPAEADDVEVRAFALAPFVLGCALAPLLVWHPSAPGVIVWVLLTLGGLHNDTRLAITGSDALAAEHAPDSGATPEAAT